MKMTIYVRSYICNFKVIIIIYYTLYKKITYVYLPVSVNISTKFFGLITSSHTEK